MIQAINVPHLPNFARATAAGNGGDLSLPGKPVGLQAQCNKEGSGSESVDELVVVTTSRKRKGNGVGNLPVQRSKRPSVFLQKMLLTMVIPTLSGIMTTDHCRKMCSRLIVMGV